MSKIIPNQQLYLFCPICNNFLKRKQRYCSRDCYHEAQRQGLMENDGQFKKGQKQSKEIIKKRRKTITGEGNPFYGKRHTEKTKHKSGQKIKRWYNKHGSPLKGKKLKSKYKDKTKHPNYGRHPSNEVRQRMSKAHKKYYENNPVPYRSARYKCGICQKGHWVRSSWEMAFADWLYNNNIEYEYECKRFFLTKELSYLPDFYVPSHDVYIEIKGYMRERNEQQHNLFGKQGYKLIVITDMKTFKEKVSFLLLNQT